MCLFFFTFSIHFTTWDASSVLLRTQETIFLEYRSITLVRYTNPSNVQIYVISEHHTASGCSGLNSLFRIFCSFWLRSESMVVWVYGFTDCIWFYLLGFNSHLTHIISHCFFSNTLS